jgi:hypothetical protein
MTNQLEPLDQFRDDVERAARTWWTRGKDWLRKWVGAQLLALLGAGGAFAGLAWVAFPYAVAAGGTLVVCLLGIYALYLRKQFADERALRRWSLVGNKRQRQDVCRRELALAEATLILVGQPQDRQARFNLHAPGGREFVAAVRYLEARVRAAASLQRPEPRSARVRRGADPVAPEVAGVRRRRELLKAEIAKLEAEIQALATPEAIELARAAEEAERSYEEQRAAAHEADRNARARWRAGRKPSPATSERSLTVAFKPNGERAARRLPAAPTPEQIARGDQPAE